jgi:hypothetical protein
MNERKAGLPAGRSQYARAIGIGGTREFRLFFRAIDRSISRAVDDDGGRKISQRPGDGDRIGDVGVMVRKTLHFQAACRGKREQFTPDLSSRAEHDRAAIHARTPSRSPP